MRLVVPACPEQPGGRAAPVVDVVSTPPSDKRAAQIARELEERIRGAGWPVGHILGSEQALVEQLRVSRDVLREAVRLLEHRRVAMMRRGPNGGLIVTEPDFSVAHQAMMLYLSYHRVSQHHIFEARRIIEPLVATMAIDALTEQRLVYLRHLTNRATSHPRGVVALLAKITDNIVVELFADALVHYSASRSAFDGEETEHATAQACLISGRDSEDELLGAVMARDKARASLVILDTIHPRAQQLSTVDVPAILRRSDGIAVKAAEKLSGNIFGRIVREGLAPGAPLGEERELLASYKVSRSVLREAVRLMEHYSAVYMRRGPGGGLTVGRLDTRAVADMVALYLTYRRVSTAEVCAVRNPMEVEIASLLCANGGLREDFPFDSDSGWQYHRKLAEMTCNPVLVLLSTVLAGLHPRPGTCTRNLRGSAEGDGQVTNVHGRITSAIVSGDRDLACYRMHEHLRSAFCADSSLDRLPDERHRAVGL